MTIELRYFPLEVWVLLNKTPPAGFHLSYVIPMIEIKQPSFMLHPHAQMMNLRASDLQMDFDPCAKIGQDP